MARIDEPVREKSPCYGCQKREPGCHGKCKDFKAWRQMVEKANEARKEYREKPPIKFT